jgi:hypothetical protein
MTQPTFRKQLVVGKVNGRRIATRASGVAGMLLLVAGWRLDQAVRTAYASRWLNADGLRLPSETWRILAAGAPFAGVVLLLAAVYVWQKPDGVGPEGAGQADLRRLAYVAALVVFAGAVAGARYRLRAVSNHGSGELKYATYADIAALSGLAIVVLFVGVRSGDVPTFIRVQRFMQRHRINLIGVVGLAFVLTVLPQTSAQAIDSIRTWTRWSWHGADRLTFGLASAALLALVVYESSARLTLAVVPEKPKDLAARWWLFAAGVLLGIWAILSLVDIPAPALLVCVGILAVVGVLELFLGARHATGAISTGLDTTRRDLSPAEAASQGRDVAPEYLAVVPLLAIAAITVAAAVDATLSDPSFQWESTAVLLPGIALAVLAILMTGDFELPCLKRLPGTPKGWVSSALGVVVAAELLIVVDAAWPKERDLVAALVGATILVAAVVYAWILFHAHPALADRVDRSLVALPVAICTGIVVFLAVHYDVQAVASVLGVFAVVNLSLAFILAALHYVVAWSLDRRAPRVLAALGARQLPLVFLVLLAWILTGLIHRPAGEHDARVLSPAVATGPRPTLGSAFADWTNAQRALTFDGRRPVPLVVVASHGGGIRAAFWTALVLDCIVGVSSVPATNGPLVADDETTCTNRRRNNDTQRRAARKIFMASGVSGGAVGLYAYTAQLLKEGGALGKKNGWVAESLGGDFAAETMAWGLFHDVPNHFFAIHPKSGGICRVHTPRGDTCWTQDRAAVLERTFEHRRSATADFGVRHVWALRQSKNLEARMTGRSVPLLVMNSTVAGGKTRAITSAADLADWPSAERPWVTRTSAFDARPLAGTAEVADAICSENDMRVSTAALLAARFPYVTPSGRVAGDCDVGRAKGAATDPCRRKSAPGCEMRLVDGGYAENSGLFTAEVVLPQLRELARRWNTSHPDGRPIAIVLVELDNHYRAAVNEPVATGGVASQTLVPPLTAFGSHGAMETFARANAYRVTPNGCTVTISPGLHPGLVAPLGWELSLGSQEDLRRGLVRPPAGGSEVAALLPVARLRLLQEWLADGEPRIDFGPDLAVPLTDCVPR